MYTHTKTPTTNSGLQFSGFCRHGSFINYHLTNINTEAPNLI